MKSQEVIIELSRASRILSESRLVIIDMDLYIHSDKDVQKAIVEFHKGLNISHGELLNLIKHFAEDLSDAKLAEVGKKAGWGQVKKA